MTRESSQTDEFRINSIRLEEDWDIGLDEPRLTRRSRELTDDIEDIDLADTAPTVADEAEPEEGRAAPPAAAARPRTLSPESTLANTTRPQAASLLGRVCHRGDTQARIDRQWRRAARQRERDEMELLHRTVDYSAEVALKGLGSLVAAGIFVGIAQVGSGLVVDDLARYGYSWLVGPDGPPSFIEGLPPAAPVHHGNEAKTSSPIREASPRHPSYPGSSVESLPEGSEAPPSKNEAGQWLVTSAAELRYTFNHAGPGDVIMLEEGVTISGQFVIPEESSGTAEQRVTVLGNGAIIDGQVSGIAVTLDATYWRFQDLTVTNAFVGFEVLNEQNDFANVSGTQLTNAAIRFSGNGSDNEVSGLRVDNALHGVVYGTGQDQTDGSFLPTHGNRVHDVVSTNMSGATVVAQAGSLDNTTYNGLLDGSHLQGTDKACVTDSGHNTNLQGLICDNPVEGANGFALSVDQSAPADWQSGVQAAYDNLSATGLRADQYVIYVEDGVPTDTTFVQCPIDDEGMPLNIPNYANVPDLCSNHP